MLIRKIDFAPFSDILIGINSFLDVFQEKVYDVLFENWLQ